MSLRSLARLCSGVYWNDCCKRFCLRMAHTGKQDHLDRTADNTREKMLCDAVVVKMQDLSSTVKGLTLEIAEAGFNFKAGQWVDFHIASLETVGGFSMASAPRLLRCSQQLELAVKYSSHSPAHWLHTQCAVGSQVKVRVGGDFCYSPIKSDVQRHLLLIAGGVGINPMISIMRHVRDLKWKKDPAQPGRVTLLYSAASEEELIFKNDIDQICSADDAIRSKYFITQDRKTNTGNIIYSRISRLSLNDSLAELDGNKRNIDCYICGPSPMIDDMEEALCSLALDKSQIHYEKWW